MQSRKIILIVVAATFLVILVLTNPFSNPSSSSTSEQQEEEKQVTSITTLKKTSSSEQEQQKEEEEQKETPKSLTSTVKVVSLQKQLQQQQRKRKKSFSGAEALIRQKIRVQGNEIDILDKNNNFNHKKISTAEDEEKKNNNDENEENAENDKTKDQDNNNNNDKDKITIGTIFDEIASEFNDDGDEERVFHVPGYRIHNLVTNKRKTDDRLLAVDNETIFQTVKNLEPLYYLNDETLRGSPRSISLVAVYCDVFMSSSKTVKENNESDNDNDDDSYQDELHCKHVLGLLQNLNVPLSHVMVVLGGGNNSNSNGNTISSSQRKQKAEAVSSWVNVFNELERFFPARFTVWFSPQKTSNCTSAFNLVSRLAFEKMKPKIHRFLFLSPQFRIEKENNDILQRFLQFTESKNLVLSRFFSSDFQPKYFEEEGGDGDQGGHQHYLLRRRRKTLLPVEVKEKNEKIISKKTRCQAQCFALIVTRTAFEELSKKKQDSSFSLIERRIMMNETKFGSCSAPESLLYQDAQKAFSSEGDVDGGFVRTFLENKKSSSSSVNAQQQKGKNSNNVLTPQRHHFRRDKKIEDPVKAALMAGTESLQEKFCFC